MINADLLKTIMEQKGINARQLAEISAVPKSTIDRILSGTTPSPNLQTAADLAVALGVSLDLLAGITPQPTDDAPDAKIVIATSQDAEIRAMLRERIEMQKAWLKRLFLANIIFMAYEVVRWVVDLTTPGVGFIKTPTKHPETAAVLLIMVAVVAVLWLMVKVITDIIRKRD
jgi:transcriptional regulator with XRE-family HTH domain